MDERKVSKKMKFKSPKGKTAEVDELNLETKIVIDIGNKTVSKTVGELLIDSEQL